MLIASSITRHLPAGSFSRIAGRCHRSDHSVWVGTLRRDSVDGTAHSCRTPWGPLSHTNRPIQHARLLVQPAEHAVAGPLVQRVPEATIRGVEIDGLTRGLSVARLDTFFGGRCPQRTHLVQVGPTAPRWFVGLITRAFAPG